MDKKQVAKLGWYSIALMALTTIHHIYGSVIYNTPWRLHVLFISIPVMVLTLILQWRLVKNGSTRSGLLFWLFIFLTLLPSMGMIGVVEGLYNHVLKNLLFFGGLNTAGLQRLFPAPTYEMPNDFLFEATGILQGFIVIPMVVYSTKLLRSFQKTP